MANTIRIKAADGTISEAPASNIVSSTKGRSSLGAIKDTLLKTARGATSSTKSAADSAGANNVVSETLGNISNLTDVGLSDVAKQQDQVTAQRSQLAEGKGFTAEAGAAIRNFLDAPVSATAEAAGSLVPTVAAMRLAKGKVNPTTAATVLGAGQGAGAVKGSIYDATKQQALKDGYSDVDAEQLAQEAQSYTGENKDQIALGTGLGLIASRTGVEGSAALTGKAANKANTLLGGTIKGFLTEGATEGAQGGQERMAANIALQRQGHDVDTMRGVTGQAVQEGIAGGVPGAGFGMVDAINQPSPREQLKETILAQDNGPLSQAAATAAMSGASDETIAANQLSEFDAQLEAVANTLTNRESIRALRENGLSAEFVTDLINTYQTAKNPDLPIKTREQALGYVQDMIAQNFQMVGEPTVESANFNRDPRLLTDGNATQPQTTQAPTQSGEEGQNNAQASAGNRLFEQAEPASSAATATSLPGGRGALSDANQSDGAVTYVARNKKSGDVIRVTDDPNEASYFNDDIEMVEESQHDRDVESGLFDAPLPEGVTYDGAFEPSARTQAGDLLARTGVPKANIDEPANQAATSPLNTLAEPSQAQKEAGNYKVGRVKLNGLDISIENPDQSTRSGVDPDGNQWQSTMNGHYGYVKGVIARAPDKEHVDVNIKPSTPADYDGTAYVINQNDPSTGKFDEPKVYVGYDSEQSAVDAYMSNYETGWQGLGSVTPVTMDRFKKLLNQKSGFMKPVKPTLREVAAKRKAEKLNQAADNSDVRKSRTTENTGSVSDKPIKQSKREKAIQRIAEGRAWFGSEAKANSFIEKNSLNDSHEAVNSDRNRWDIVEKREVESRTDQESGELKGSDTINFVSDGLEKNGWLLHDPSDSENPRVYRDNGHTRFGTYEKNGVRIALRSGKSLRANRNQVDVYEGAPGEVIVEAVIVDPDKRKKGLGTAAMQEIVDYADQANNRLYIEPTPLEKGGLSKAGLTSLYKKFGFVEADESGLVLVRNPNAETKAPKQAKDQESKPLNDSDNSENDATAKNYVKKESTENVTGAQERDNATTTEPNTVPQRSESGDIESERTRRGDSEPVATGVASDGQRPDKPQPVQDGLFGAGTKGTPSTIGGAEQPESSNGQREASDDGNNTDATSDRVDDDFTITDDIKLGKGGLTKKYRDNVDAIRIIKTLESENRKATPEERSKLAKYAGFGALKGVFDRENKQWSKQYRELKDLLTDEEYTAARASVLNAHYTAKSVVDGMYNALGRLGFKAGRVLEPSLGSGNFFGLMPNGVRTYSQLHGVELDVLTSRIAKHLYPNAKIAASTGFQEYNAPNGYFDLVIGNPPFGSEKIYDTDKTPYSGFSIHNYFLAKSIDKLRDGGVMSVVVSNSFMDANQAQTREWIAQRANLLGAMRLPNDAFKENAGTEVVTDVLFFQKTAEPQENPSWLKSNELTLANDKTGESHSQQVNQYFIDNPQNVLGDQASEGTMYRGDSYTVKSNGDISKQIDQFIKSLPKDVYTEAIQPIETLDSADHVVPNGVKVGTYYADEQGNIRQRTPDVMSEPRSIEWVAPNDSAIKRMRGMMELRDTLRRQMRSERDGVKSQKAIENNRKKLNDQYDAFVKEFGMLNRSVNRRLFIDDTESALLQALEFDFEPAVSKLVAKRDGIDPAPEKSVKADIFNRRVLFPPQTEITVTTATDSLYASLDAKGTVDLDYMADAYNKPASEIIDELGDVIFDDPLSGHVLADDYLSGDVKTKLEEAKAAANTDPKYQRNVDALKKVIPADKLPSEIFASVGANWIPADVYQSFATLITGAQASAINLKYIRATATWSTGITATGDAGLMTSDYGTGKLNAFNLLDLMLNGKTPVVKYRVRNNDGTTSTHTDIEATELAKAKFQRIREKWDSWLYDDPQRADRLATIYNEKFNRTVERKYDGSHLKLHGSSPAITLRPHQKDVVWRGIQSRRVLYDHVVGAGKTFAAVATVMEFRRLGIARKPLLIVPNHLTLQWRSDFTKLYPSSNILAATPEDFSKDNRKRMFAKMVTGDYDAIIIGHSSLKKVGLPPEIEQRMIKDQLDEIANAIEEIKRDRGDRGIIRDMEKIKKSIEAKMDKLKEKGGKKDDVVYFDELGVDALMVDEMHEFKNLYFTTQMQRVSGLGNPSGSGKSFDLFMKILFSQEVIGEDAPLITATGTPVSNSLSEMFTMQRFMQYQEMKRQDLHLFDAWARQYGDIENVYEVAPSGVGYRQSTRFSKFKNLPSLMANYRGFADVITLQDLKDQTSQQIDDKTGKPKEFPVPKMKTGRPINVIADRSDLQSQYFGVPELSTDESGNILFQAYPETATIEENKEGKFVLAGDGVNGTFDTKEDAQLELVVKSLTPKTTIDKNSILGQFANLKELTKKTDGKINALSLTGLANKAGLDYRLIDPTAADNPNSKINLAIDRMLSEYKDWRDDNGTQLVFLDSSIPVSAQNSLMSKERRVFVRDPKGDVTHKKGTVFKSSEYNAFPLFLVTKGKGEAKYIEVYEPMSGLLMETPALKDKAQAKKWAGDYVATESNRFHILSMRDTSTLESDAINEYRDLKELEVTDDNEITRDDLENIASDSKFSVYDDMKAKLIDKGIPENEIAFIHDYNTPKKKEALFKLVNKGKVRFLFGSTPKLGAGTNVQERLVALHHIDAPWRPSDLEQREGRIIRQGNKLYARDTKGFEVGIYRYATEQTYDTRRWQLLEHKASGVEQLRNYTGEAEIEDITAEAANSADMKAAASGNPLILEETKLRTEIKRLQSLQKGHADSKYSMNRKIKENENWVNEFYPKRKKTAEDVMATANKHPLPKDSKQVAMLVVNGKKTTDREAAIEHIGNLANKVRANFSKTDQATINYRGIDFTVMQSAESGAGSIRIDAPFDRIHTYGLKDSFSPSGLLTRLNNWIDSQQSRIAYLDEYAQEAKQESESLAKRLDVPFEQAGELKDTQAKHADVKRRLLQSTQLEAVPEEQINTFKQLVKDRKAALRDMGYESAVNEFESDKPLFSRTNGTPSTIKVNGKPRPTTNSNGKPIADSVEKIENFYKWFGDSKVVGEQGGPLVVYHGTNADFDTFDTSTSGAVGDGSYFTSVFEEAVDYAAEKLGVEPSDENDFGGDWVGSHIKEVYLNITDAKDILPSMYGDGKIYIARNPNQIKSATGNNGNFDADNDSILLKSAQKATSDANSHGFKTDRAKEIAAELKQKYPNIPDVQLYDNHNDLPINQKYIDEVNQQARDKIDAISNAKSMGETMAALSLKVNEIQGVYQNGEIMINLDAIMDEAHFRRIYAHEAIGHLSVESMLNEVDPALLPKLIKQIQALNKMGNKYIKGVWQDVESNQPGIGADNTAKEVLAYIAERGDHQKDFQPVIRKMWQKIIDGIKAFAKLVFDVQMADQDVRDIVAMAERYAAGEVDQSQLTSVYARGKPHFSQSNPTLPDTIKVNGIERPTSDSEGNPIHSTLEGVKNFWEWFDGNDRNRKNSAGKGGKGEKQSGVPSNNATSQARPYGLDRDGKPRRFYHGTASDFATFELDHKDKKDKGWLGNGIYITNSVELAEVYTGTKGGDAAPNMMPMYAALHNPYYVDLAFKQDMKDATDSERDRFNQYLIDNGHDGVVLSIDDKADQVMVLNPNQLKSDIGNNGDFSLENDNILFSRTTANDFNNFVQQNLSRSKVFDAAMTSVKGQSAKEFNFLKNIRTQYDKAKQDPNGFGRMFDAAQRFELDARLTAARPAEAAPNLLSADAEGFGESVNKIGKGDKTQVDKKAVSNFLFNGTLAGESVLDGKVFTDGELRAQGATDAQISLYKEARAAIDQSLDEMTAGLAFNMVRKQLPELRKAIIDNPSKAGSAIVGALRKQYKPIVDQIEAERKKDDPDTDLIEQLNKQSQPLIATAGRIGKVFEHVNDLKKSGYAPLSRFGKFSLTAYNDDGEVAAFYRFETETEAKVRAKALEKRYPRVERGVMPTAPNNIFAGADPETVALFVEHLEGEGFDIDKSVMEEWYQVALSDRSAMKRMLSRKGVEGFDKDIERVLSSFITSNSRFAASNYNRADMLNVLDYLRSDPEYKRKGDVFDEAKELFDYVTEPKDPFTVGRSLMFGFFMGGSIGSAAVNLTQPFTQTLPHLYRFASLTEASKALMDGIKMAGKIVFGKYKPRGELGEMLKMAKEFGIVDPQETHHLYRMGSGSALNRFNLSRDLRTRMSGMSSLWGMMFARAESLNRYSTFIAAYNVAKKKGLDDKFNFAKVAVEETQGIYSKENRPNWARGTGSLGTVGAMAFTFKQFSIGYTEMLYRNLFKNGAAGRRSAYLQLGVLMLLSGGLGMPFADDAEDLLDTAIQFGGGEGNTKRWLHDRVIQVLGEDLGMFALYGVSTVMPFDIQGRMSMSDLIPATDLLMPSNSDYRANSALEVLGAPGSFMSDILETIEGFEEGKSATDLAKEMAPVAVQNAFKAASMLSDGFYSDTRGRRVIDTNPLDAMFKGIGFQPSRVAKTQKRLYTTMRSVSRVKQVESDIAGKMAKARFDKDSDAYKDAVETLQSWNESNPDLPIKITPRQVANRIKQMRMTREERMRKTTAKELRGLI